MPFDFIRRTTPAALLILLVACADRAIAQSTPDQPRDQPRPTSETGVQSWGLLPEPEVIGQAIDYFGHRIETASADGKDGFYPEIGNMVTGSGWISLGPGYRHHFADGRALVDTSAAISWRGYTIAQGRAEFQPLGDARLTVGSQGMWQDFKQVRYYGLGPDTTKADRSEYRVQDVDVVGYANWRVKEIVTIGGRFGWLRQPKLRPSAGPFDSNYPYTRLVFGENEAPGINSPAGFLHGDLSVAVDTRDHPSYTSRGGLYRAGWADYSDRDTGRYSFRRYEAEASQFVPLVSHWWTLALHGWLLTSDTSDGKSVPFYLLPSLGGHNTLRGYRDYRFHDRNLLVLNAESRFLVFNHIDAAVFADAGNVAPRVRDLNVDKTSYGIGFRVHSQRATFARLDFGHSVEGWHIMFKLDDVLNSARYSRRIVTVPFVP